MTNTPKLTQASDLGRGRWWVLLTVGVGTFMAALDGSVVNTILPVVRAEMRTGIATIEWVVTTYLLVLSGLLLTFGRLGDLRGHKPIYLLGFGIFGLGSVLCGIAQGPAQLIAFRGFQALGAAMLASNAPAILTKSFPPEQRGRALGLQATMTYLGLTTGPSLGGWLAQALGWRWVFYINVPVGLLALGLSVAFVPNDTPRAPGERTERFDVSGAALFMAGLVALLLGLNQGHAWGWMSPAVLGLLAAAGLLLGLFIWVEARVPAPMLHLGLFRQRLFAASTASAVFNYICVYSIVFLMPFYLIQGRGLSPAQAGLLLSTEPIVMAIVAPISGALSDRVGSRLPATLGMLVMAAALLWLGRLTAQGAATPLSHVALALGLAGLGTGTFISPNSSALMGAAPRQRQGIAAGVLATARNLGMVLGVGLAGAVLTSVAGAEAGGTLAGQGRLLAGISAALLVAAGVSLLAAITAANR